jgi:hypothetical protein
VATVREKRFCGAKKRQAEGTCTRPSGWGTTHAGWGRCKLHGGSTQSSVTAAQTERLDHEARVLFGKVVNAEPIDNPLAGYAEFAGRVMAWMRTMDDLLDGLKSPRYGSEAGEQIRGEVQLFERAMDRCNTVLSSYARLKIDERLARIHVEQKTMVIRAIEAALTSAGLSAPQVVEAKKVAARHLRVVDAA